MLTGAPDVSISMALHLGDVLKETAHLSPAEFGAHFRLCMASWSRGGYLPPVPDQLRRLAGVDSADWPAVWSVIAELWPAGAGGLAHNPRTLAEIERAQTKKASYQARGKLGGRPAKAKVSQSEVVEQMPSNPPSRGRANVEQSVEQTSSTTKAGEKPSFPVFTDSGSSAESLALAEGKPQSEPAAKVEEKRPAAAKSGCVVTIDFSAVEGSSALAKGEAGGKTPSPSPSEVSKETSICPETASPSSRPAEPSTLPGIGFSCDGPPKPPKEIPVLGFPCDGQPREWFLYQSQIDEWTPLFPTLDILGECRQAWAWVNASPQNRKTAGGMARFLVGWFGRSKNRGAFARPTVATGRPPGAFPARPAAPAKTRAQFEAEERAADEAAERKAREFREAAEKDQAAAAVAGLVAEIAQAKGV